MSLPDNHPHKDHVDGLRKLADFLEDNQEFPLTIGGLTLYLFALSKEDFAKQARLIGSAEKQDNGMYLTMHKNFSPTVKLDLSCDRDKICERVQVGERVLPAEPERIIPETILPAKPETREPIWEWRCPDSLLALDKADAITTFEG